MTSDLNGHAEPVPAYTPSTPEQHTIEAIARVAYEACASYETNVSGEEQPLWDDAPEARKADCRAGVVAHLAEDMKSGDAHNQWVDRMKKAGWRYGASRNVLQRTDPLVRPWHHLPIERQITDHIFRCTILGMAAAIAAPPPDALPPDETETSDQARH